MRIRIPSKRICEKFHLTYELLGAQKGVNVLTKYYEIRRMKIVVDGRKVGNSYEAQYFGGTATFTKQGFKKINVLHELYHHLVESYGLEIPLRKEERFARKFTVEVMTRR